MIYNQTNRHHGTNGHTMEIKASKKAFAKALKIDGVWYGQFALPGMEPAFVMRDGRKRGFTHEANAEIAASRAMTDVYNERMAQRQVVNGYRRLSGLELSAMLLDVDITPTELGDLLRLKTEHVYAWINGERETPHYIHLVLSLLEYDENYNLAWQLADEVQESTNG